MVVSPYFPDIVEYASEADVEDELWDVQKNRQKHYRMEIAFSLIIAYAELSQEKEDITDVPTQIGHEH